MQSYQRTTKVVELFQLETPPLETAVHGAQFFFFIRHFKSIMLDIYPYLSLQQFLVKRLMAWLIVLNANQRAKNTSQC